MIDKETEVERKYADEKYGSFHSTHEGFGVLMEEVTELQEAIRQNDGPGIYLEAIQVAAVAQRIAACTEVPECRRRSGIER